MELRMRRSLRLRRRVQDRSLINKQDAERAHHLTNPSIVIPNKPKHSRAAHGLKRCGL
jgi:hypothetical protein